MNYKIIANGVLLHQFIDWLPTLKPEETFYVCLLARSKYCTGVTHVRSDKAQLKRLTANKENLITKLRQLECEEGSYFVKDVPAPQESLAVYITPNPRNLQLAAVNGLKKFADLVTKPYNGYNPHQEIMSEIQKAKSRTVFVDFDFDVHPHFTAKDFYPEITEVCNDEAIHILKTRGGYHVLIETSKIYPSFKDTWYNKMIDLQRLFSDDITNADREGEIENMIPIPGCYQGGFVPVFIS